MKLDFDGIAEDLSRAESVRTLGKVSKVIGLTIEAEGLVVELGEMCIVKSKRRDLRTEVVGFKEDSTILMPLGEMHEIKMGAEVVPTGKQVSIKVGPNLKGRVIDAFGEPLDDGIKLRTHHEVGQWGEELLNPLKKSRITDQMFFGVRALDGFLSCGKGQRMGIFAGSGVGKSTLMGMIAKNANADINVIALIGERGREVREFIEESLGPEGLKRSIVVVATGDQPALIRIKAALFAHSIAEYFRDVEGKDVLLMLDSVTRVALAQREIGLAVGEPPATRGYTPSVFSIIPKLLERAGTGERGSITALYTVLVDGDDMNEPISDLARGVLDGHIVLSRKLAHQNHYPAIDVLQSVSRVMGSIVTPEHKAQAGKIRTLMASYEEAKDLINIGAYQKGSNPAIDKAVASIDKINSILRQQTEDYTSYEELTKMMQVIK
ncbi:MAG: FliI/YscN family ATPase [Candidatus Caenarcaniphilales bacterium]|nr:FliI/YscN family ATPase [Candidatus Caenarcaniphilales bacterium]